MAMEIRKTLRFSESEYQQIEQKLSEHNLSFSEFARSAILRKKVKTKITLEHVHQLQRVGNNLNQIARSLNRCNSDIPNSTILQELVKIEKLIEQVNAS